MAKNSLAGISPDHGAAQGHVCGAHARHGSDGGGLNRPSRPSISGTVKNFPMRLEFAVICAPMARSRIPPAGDSGQQRRSRHGQSDAMPGQSRANGQRPQQRERRRRPASRRPRRKLIGEKVPGILRTRIPLPEAKANHMAVRKNCRASKCPNFFHAKGCNGPCSTIEKTRRPLSLWPRQSRACRASRFFGKTFQAA